MSAPLLITQNIEDSVTELYLGFFGRAPDVGGFAFWAQQLAIGISPTVVAANFAQSAEFIAMYSALTPEQTVTKIYQHILERAPDAGGQAFWANALKADAPIGDIVWSLVNSAFSQQGTADGLLVQSHVTAAELALSNPLSMPVISSWSAQSGFGQIDVAGAFHALLGKDLPSALLPKAVSIQPGLSDLHFQNAWTAGYTGKGVVIADIDTGVDLTNSALTHNLSTASWNFVSNNNNVQDDNGHGTAVATELIAHGTDNGNVFTGAAYDAQLMVLKTLDAKGAGSVANTVKAIDYAVDHGAQVINLSLGGSAPDPSELVALNYAANHGVIVTIAVGDAGASGPQFPAAYAQLVGNTIAVGASASNGSAYTLASFSNLAGTSTPYAFVDAPGSHIFAYGLNGQVQSWSGASFAAPLVAAQAALLISANTGASSEQITQAIVHTTISLVAAIPIESPLA
jgi:subtilisin family serine protease